MSTTVTNYLCMFVHWHWPQSASGHYDMVVHALTVSTKNYTVGVVVLQKLQILQLYSDQTASVRKLSIYHCTYSFSTRVTYLCMCMVHDTNTQRTFTHVLRCGFSASSHAATVFLDECPCFSVALEQFDIVWRQKGIPLSSSIETASASTLSRTLHFTFANLCKCSNLFCDSIISIPQWKWNSFLSVLSLSAMSPDVWTEVNCGGLWTKSSMKYAQ